MALDFGMSSSLFKTSEDRNVGITESNEYPAGHGKDRIYLWTCSGTAFKAAQIDSTNIDYGYNNGDVTNNDGVAQWLVASVHLPDGAKVESVICYGSSAGDDWVFRRGLRNGASGESIFAAAINTEDTTVSATGKDVIDNNTYIYWLVLDTLGDGEDCYGAKIKYIMEDPDSITGN